MLPMSVTLEMPEMINPDTPGARVNRTWAGSMKDGLRAVLRTHWKKRMPGHFRATARSKYQHFPRTKAYKRRKMRKFGSRTDLVMTGDSKRKMLSTEPTVRVGGKAQDGTLRATMTLKWPTSKDKSNPPQGVGRVKMNDELSRWVPSEEAEASRQFRSEFAISLNRRMKQKRVRRRFGSYLSSYGINP